MDPKASTRGFPRRETAYGLFLAALWGLLTGGEAASWGIGLPGIAAALALRRRLDPPCAAGFSLGGTLRFLLYFLRASFAGGIDVIRRAFDPRLPLAPGFVRRRLRLSSPAARVLCTATASLLPGTVSVRLEGNDLTLHALDRGARLEAVLDELESRVQGVFGGLRAERR